MTKPAVRPISGWIRRRNDRRLGTHIRTSKCKARKLTNCVVSFTEEVVKPVQSVAEFFSTTVAKRELTTSAFSYGRLSTTSDDSPETCTVNTETVPLRERVRISFAPGHQCESSSSPTSPDRGGGIYRSHGVATREAMHLLTTDQSQAYFLYT